MAEPECKSHSVDPGPCRRPAASSKSDFADSAKTAWTSARCNRLLRPLSSKIALLRKEIELQTWQNEHESKAPISTNPEVIGFPLTNKDVNWLRQLPEPENIKFLENPREWELSPRPRKRIKRTYSSKTKESVSNEGSQVIKSQNTCTASVAIELPPQLAQEETSSTSSVVNTETDQPHSLSQKEFALTSIICKALVPDHWKLVDGICKGYVALLRATCGRKSLHKTGCRSLLSTCIRQTPRYIAEEELMTKSDDPNDDVDISAFVYNQLEELGSVHGGWEPLRILVRAHGTKLITDAIEQGLLGPPVAQCLAQLCLHIFAGDETQQIIESLSEFVKSSDNVRYDPHMISNSVAALESYKGNSGFLFRHTAKMLTDEVFPIDWISDRSMIGTWNKVIRSITERDNDATSAILLLGNAIDASRGTMNLPSEAVDKLRLQTYQASHRPTLRSTRSIVCPDGSKSTRSNTNASNIASNESSNDRTTSTLSSVFTVLCAVACIQGRTAAQNSNKSSPWVTTALQFLATEAKQAVELAGVGKKLSCSDKSYDDSMYLPLLASGIAELSLERSPNISEQNLPAVFTLVELPRNEVLRIAGPFICAVARCRGRANSENPFDSVKAIVQHLISVPTAINSSRPLRELVHDLAIATAFAYAEETARPVHLEWALETESSLEGKAISTPKPPTARTPIRGGIQTKSRFRWEEGICEWIAKTPSLSLPKPVEAAANINQLETDTPTLGRDINQVSCLQTASWCEPSEAKSFKEPGPVSKLKEVRILVPSRATSWCTGRPSIERPSSKVIKASGRMYKLVEPTAPTSPQAKDSALSSLLESPNALLGQKRKRTSERVQGPSATEEDSTFVPKRQVPGYVRTPEIGDIDELALSYE